MCVCVLGLQWGLGARVASSKIHMNGRIRDFAVGLAL